MVAFAFVLHPAPVALDPEAVRRAHQRLCPQAPALQVQPSEAEADADGVSTICLRFADGAGEVIAATASASIPDGEAEQASELSVFRFRPAWEPIGPHLAHTTVVLHGAEGLAPGPRLARLTWACAAVAQASQAQAIYWGNGRVTTEAEVFLDTARGLAEDDLPLPIWTGVSVAQERGGVSFLSLGIEPQFGLPDLLLWAPQAAGDEALGLLFDLHSYVIGRGQPIAPGETVGRSAEERLTVRYETSPVDDEKQVWCVDLPAD